jgi:hypothetical protein
MIETTALSPYLGVEITGVHGEFDDVLISRCEQLIGVNGRRNT